MSSSLPDELLLSIFARVSSLYYPTLALVSKSVQSLLALPELYRIRSVINRTDICLYVCLMFPHDSNPRWFTLCRKPNKTLINETGRKKERTSSILVPIQNSKAHWKCVAAVGCSIYAIGEEAHPKAYYDISKDEGVYSSSVSILDCQTHTWRDGPSMHVQRNSPSANVFDGKIYVAGGTKDKESSDWMEVFDPETQAWEIVTNTLAQRGITHVYESGVIDGEIYMFGYRHGVIYKPKDNRWEETHDMFLNFSCVGNVLYSYCSWYGIQWYDFTKRRWNTLKGDVGFEGLLKTPGSPPRLVDFGGKMAVLWDETTMQDKVTLWCGVIKLKKLNSEEIWGEVEWFDPVFTVPNSFFIEHALCATV